jgi:hypothetical protein
MNQIRYQSRIGGRKGMTIILRLFYSIVLGVMLLAVFVASKQENLLSIPTIVSTDPWFITTLLDTYFAFLSIFFFICYREKSAAKRVLWFVAVMTLGNIAIATYFLIALFKLKDSDKVQALFS